jgi:hypothetical protein
MPKCGCTNLNVGNPPGCVHDTSLDTITTVEDCMNAVPACGTPYWLGGCECVDKTVYTCETDPITGGCVCEPTAPMAKVHCQDCVPSFDFGEGGCSGYILCENKCAGNVSCSECLEEEGGGGP